MGFRYQTLDIAKGFDVSGYVKNEVDGTVTLEIEGEETEINTFQDEVAQELQSFIKEFDEISDLREAQFCGFRIS